MALVFVLFSTGFGTALDALLQSDCRSFGFLRPATAAAAAAAVAVTSGSSAALVWTALTSSCLPSLGVPGDADFSEKEYYFFLFHLFFCASPACEYWG